MNQEKNQFRLDVRLDNKPPMKIDVIDTITVGLDPRCDLVLSGTKIKNRHLEFIAKGENLALVYLGNTNQTFLNSLPLEEGKTYLLEIDDRIQLSGAEIIVRSEVVLVHESQRVKPIVFNSLEDLTPESIPEKIVYADNPTGSMRREVHVRPNVIDSIEGHSIINLWVVKTSSLVFDFFITYLVLAVLLPIVFAQDYAIVIIDYLASVIFPLKTHSFFKFFIAWYLLSFAQTLVFGTTIGQFLLGLRHKGENKFGKLIFFRLKTFLFSLFLLPAQNSLSQNYFFKGVRKVGVFLVILFIVFSPFFLPSPYNLPITPMVDGPSTHKELRARSIFSFSKDLQVNLNAELSPRYMLLPYVGAESKKRAFELFDLKTNTSIVIKEVRDFFYNDLDDQMEYANPLYKTFHRLPFSELTIREKKEMIEVALMSSPGQVKSLFLNLGPFFGSATLIKSRLMEGITTNEATLKSYAPQSPMFFIGSTGIDYYYVFTPMGIKCFSIDSPNKGALSAVFEEQIWSKLLSESENTVVLNRQNVDLLLAQDSFLHGDEQTFLTYYVGVANNLSNVRIVHAEMDLTDRAKRAVIKNIDAVMKSVTNKNVHKSFADIKNQLTPMENPGEK
nr:FHA domain-containing protein [Bacteriovorax sp. HI3]